MHILTCENLTKTYLSGQTAFNAVDHVNLAIQQGSFTAITGPSGSGKSTLLHMMGCLESPSEGRVVYQDMDTSKLNDNQLSVLRRRRFGFVFQQYNLVGELTGLENILLPVMLDAKKPDEAHINQLIDVLGIRDRVDHLPSALSGGQQQRVSIARALANKPAVLFADEPTGNLDGQAGREVLSLLQALRRTLSITLVLVTHDLSIAEQAERVLRLEDGAIVRDTIKEGGLA